MQIHGIRRFTINGEEVSVADSVSIEMGGEVLEVQNAQTTHDYTTRYEPGAIECQVAGKAEEDMRSRQGTRDATIVLELRDGRAFTGSGMAFVGNLALDPITGRYTARFVGEPLQEI
ncbi:MAG: hypothetical protein GC161_18400 [Planctomycetaceae bacterium]|nr:hypothetical protein [Planctomycetaceae bacterium]